jgi:hypothetical protein
MVQKQNSVQPEEPLLTIDPLNVCLVSLECQHYAPSYCSTRHVYYRKKQSDDATERTTKADMRFDVLTAVKKSM